MVYDDRVKNYARKIFFELNDQGERRYDYKENCTLTQEHFKDVTDLKGTPVKELRPETIETWSRKKDLSGMNWHDIYKKSLQRGKEKATAEIEVYLENKQIVEELSDITKFRSTFAKAAMMKGWAYLMNAPIDSEKTAKWLLEFGAKELDKLEGIMKPEEQEIAQAAFDKVLEVTRRNRERREKEVILEAEVVNETNTGSK